MSSANFGKKCSINCVMANKIDSMDIVLASIFEHIDDEIFRKLKTVFEFSGRGRRPALPSNLEYNNRLLLQLYFLKDGTKTWDDIANFGSNIIGIQQSRLRALIIQTHKDTQELDDKNLLSFLSTRLEFVGQHLHEHNIGRIELLDTVASDRNVRPELISITNGIVLDLLAFNKKEDLPMSWTCKAIYYLSGVSVDIALLKKEVKKLKETATKKCKSQSRSDAYAKFLAEPFSDFRSRSRPPRTPSAPPCQKRMKFDNEMDVGHDLVKNFPDAQNSPLLSALNEIQIKKLKGNLKVVTNDLRDEQQKTKTLRELISHKIQDFESQMEIKLHDLKSKEESLNILQNRYDKCKVQLETLQTALDEKRIELTRVRQAPYYKRMKRWDQNLKKREASLATSNDLKSKQTVNKLKRKVKLTQTLLSNSRTLQKKNMAESTKLQWKLQQMQNEFLVTPCDNVPTLKMREENSNKFTKDVVKCVIELIGRAEISGKNCGTVMEIVARNLFDIKLESRDLPSERSSLRYADKGHVLAKQQLAETIIEASFVDLHSDGTTKDHNKVVGHQISTDGGLLLSCGFTSVCCENTETLVDIAYNLLNELADVHPAYEVDGAFRSILKRITGLMSDRASVMKSFNKAFTEKRCHSLADEHDDVEFLHCNAHFLLGMSAASDKILKVWEKDQEKKIGRANFEKFKKFSSASENAGSRFIRTACDILGPRGDEKNGCKDSWEAFCSMQDILSTVTSFRGNRFNNLFQAAASLHYHRDELINFLKNYMPALNMKQESVLYDAECDSVDAIMVALGLVYQKVTGPYWVLMRREVKYLDFFNYVTEMHDSLDKWQNEASQLTEEDCPPLFDIKVKSSVFPSLYDISNDKRVIVVDILQKLCAAYKDVVERQLSDFLPEGRYHNITDPVKIEKMAHSKLTNLIGEACFGDLDFSIFKRRHASIHHHSTINMLKRNSTSAWFDNKSENEQIELLRVCATKSEDLRRKHQQEQRNVLANRKYMLAQSRVEKEKKAADLAEKKRKLAEVVQENGGPCLKSVDVLRLLTSKNTNTAKLSAIKDQIRYHKTVLGVSSSLLKLGGSLKTVTKCLMSYLGSEDDALVMSDSESNSTNEKTDESDTESDIEDECDTIVDKADFGNFNFSKQGQYIAVFYDDDFYIGQVLELESSQASKISFMEKCRVKTNAFRWATNSDVDTVASEFVFDWDFDMTSSNGRMWSIATQNRYMVIEKRYQLYRELYC